MPFFIYTYLFINKLKYMAEKFINIRFPFQNSSKGYFLEMNKTDKDAIKSDLMHLILTQKGERLYNPNFGTNLLKFIFEPNDGLTFGDIRAEINDVVRDYIPELQINGVDLEILTENEHVAKLTLNYSITDGTFESKDFVEIKI